MRAGLLAANSPMQAGTSRCRQQIIDAVLAARCSDPGKAAQVICWPIR
jgi:hypothetical protein